MDNAGITFNRFRNDQAFQHGFEAGGRILGQGSLVLGRYGRTISEAPYDSESEIETAMEQEADLENWARLNGYWHDDPNAYFKGLGILPIQFTGARSGWQVHFRLASQEPYTRNIDICSLKLSSPSPMVLPHQVGE